MSWEIGVSTGCFYPFRTMDQALGEIGDAGFTIAELFLQTPSEYSAVFARRVLRAMLASGVGVHSIHLNMKDLDPFSPYAPRRADSDALVLRSLELANMIQAGVINWHGARRKEMERGVTLEQLWEVGARWDEWAREAEVVLTMENVSWCSMRSVEEVERVRTHLPEIHFTFDSFQAAESGASPNEVVRAMGERIVTVHLSDFDPGGARHLALGKGVIGWQPLIETLSSVGYGGPLLIELSHLTEEGWRGPLQSSREFLERCIVEVGKQLRVI